MLGVAVVPLKFTHALQICFCSLLPSFAEVTAPFAIVAEIVALADPSNDAVPVTSPDIPSVLDV